MIKVGFLMRVDAESKPGGDLVQIKRYIECGKILGAFEGELVTKVFADLRKYDVIHLTNIDRPVETVWHFRRAQRLNKPVVISTIHHSYAEIRRYEKCARAGFLSLFSGRLTFQQMELLRSLFRSIRYPTLFFPTLWLALRGVKSAQRNALLNSQKVLLLSNKERVDLLSDFSIPLEFPNYVLIRNGVDPIFAGTPQQERDIDVCVVGRIEARKNQLTILRALNQLDLRGNFVGALNRNHKSYCELFFKELGRGRSEYLGAVSVDGVHSRLARSRIHVSASWFEVSSLVDLEANLSGCVVVSSVCGATSELLGHAAFYVSPDNIEQIKAAITSALNAATRDNQSHTARPPTFRWLDAADMLSAVYSNCLGYKVLPLDSGRSL